MFPEVSTVVRGDVLCSPLHLFFKCRRNNVMPETTVLETPKGGYFVVSHTLLEDFIILT